MLWIGGVVGIAGVVGIDGVVGVAPLKFGPKQVVAVTRGRGASDSLMWRAGARALP